MAYCLVCSLLLLASPLHPSVPLAYLPFRIYLTYFIAILLCGSLCRPKGDYTRICPGIFSFRFWLRPPLPSAFDRCAVSLCIYLCFMPVLEYGFYFRFLLCFIVYVINCAGFEAGLCKQLHIVLSVHGITARLSNNCLRHTLYERQTTSGAYCCWVTLPGHLYVVQELLLTPLH